MPARAIEDKRGMRAGGYCFADLLKMPVHGFGVGVRHNKPCAHSTIRADGAEQIGPLVTRIAHGAGARSFSRPKPCQRSFLSNPRLILKPDFDGLAFGVFGKAIG
jgi:hypothetical protein